MISLKIGAYRLDGDNIRFGLNKDLGFGPEARTENIRRIAEVSKLFADSTQIAITAFISPYISDRDAARKLHDEANIPFIEVGSGQTCELTMCSYYLPNIFLKLFDCSICPFRLDRSTPMLLCQWSRNVTQRVSTRRPRLARSRVTGFF